MKSIFQNDVRYPCGNTLSRLAMQAIEDIDGNNISDSYLKKNEDKGAGFHNSIFVDKDITDLFESGELYTRISDGSFKDLFVGMHFTANYDGTDKVFRIAGFNIYKSSSGIYSNHAVIVPDSTLRSNSMMDTNSTTGGYKSSVMKTDILDGDTGVYEKLNSIFGSHMFSYHIKITNTVNSTTGVSSSSLSVISYVDLMSEMDVFGSIINSSSRHDIGSDRTQLPLFTLAPEYISCGSMWWLRGIASMTQYAYVTLMGYSDIDLASNIKYIRPRFLIG